MNRGEGTRQSSRKTGSGLVAPFRERAARVSWLGGLGERRAAFGQGGVRPGAWDEGKRSERAEGLQQCFSWGPGVWPGEGGS